MTLEQMNTSDLQATIKYLVKEIEKCQDIIQEYMNPDSTIYASNAVTRLIDILSNGNLNLFINSLKIKEQKNDKDKNISSRNG